MCFLLWSSRLTKAFLDLTRPDNGKAATKRGYEAHQAKQKALGKKRKQDRGTSANQAAGARSCLAEEALDKALRHQLGPANVKDSQDHEDHEDDETDTDDESEEYEEEDKAIGSSKSQARSDCVNRNRG